MSGLIIRDEIKKHSTENYQITASEGGSLPTKQQLLDHLFTDQIDKRNKFEDKSLLLKFKMADDNELEVCVWELACSSENFYEFFGYCGYTYYGSGLYSNKEGYGMRLINGTLTFSKDGAGSFASLNAMPEKTYHR
jgi:hypothetical protein